MTKRQETAKRIAEETRTYTGVQPTTDGCGNVWIDMSSVTNPDEMERQLRNLADVATPEGFTYDMERLTGHHATGDHEGDILRVEIVCG